MSSNKDTSQIIIAIVAATVAIIISVVTATVMVVSINKSDIGDLRTELRTEIRDVRNLLVTHIAGHSHNKENDSVADAGGLQEK